MVGKSRNMSSDMLFTPGLLGLMPPTICCVRSQSVRDLVTEISGGATPHRCGVAQSSSSELATQAWPSQPHSRLVVPVHVGSRLAHSGSPTHPSLWRLSTVPLKIQITIRFCISLIHILGQTNEIWQMATGDTVYSLLRWIRARCAQRSCAAGRRCRTV